MYLVIISTYVLTGGLLLPYSLYKSLPLMFHVAHTMIGIVFLVVKTTQEVLASVMRISVSY